MAIIDLLPEFRALVAESDSEVGFRARLWAWLEVQSQGPLGPLLSDVFHLWSGVGRDCSLEEARAVAAALARHDHVRRAERVAERHAAVVGRRAEGDIVLLAGLRRPEGYSRFDRGRNTIYLGLDHPASLREEDHFELVLAHELSHSVRDVVPEVLRDYGGEPEMTHDDFVERHPLREHLVSEGLAGAISALAYPGLSPERYVYLDPPDLAWCEANRAPIVERILRALEEGEDYRTFYAEGIVAPGSPGGCDYYLGFHLARFALEREPARELVVTPASTFLARHLEPFLDEFLGGSRVGVKRGQVRSAERSAPELAILAAPVRAFYREWLAELEGEPGAARAADEALAAGVLRERLLHAGEPYEVRAFPFLLASDEVEYVRWVVEGLMRISERVVRLYRSEAEVRAFFALPPHFESLVLAEPELPLAIPIARLDSHWDGRRLRFLELNTNGTAGILLAERIAPLWLEDERAARLALRHGLRREPLLERLIAAVESGWSAPRGARRVLVLDWSEVATRPEQEGLCKALEAAGIEAVLAAPEELAFDGETLRARGLAVQQVYRRLTLEDFLAPDPRLEPYVRAWLGGKVASLGSFAGDVAHTKRMFAFLTHERWRKHFSAEERALIDAHVPWTRPVVPGPTLRRGALRELREIALEEREGLVLKPAEGHEGRDVLLGLETGAAEWERELDRRMGRGHVLQAYVPPPVRTVFAEGARGLEPRPSFVHLGEYAFDGHLAGFLTRVSQERVLSADSRERALATFTVPEAGAQRFGG